MLVSCSVCSEVLTNNRESLSRHSAKRHYYAEVPMLKYERSSKPVYEVVAIVEKRLGENNFFSPVTVVPMTVAPVVVQHSNNPYIDDHGEECRCDQCVQKKLDAIIAKYETENISTKNDEEIVFVG